MDTIINPKSLSIALIQMTSKSDLDTNLMMLEKLFDRCAEHSMRLIVLPENCFMFSASNFLSLAQDDEAQERISTFLECQSRRLDSYIVAGSLPIASKDPGKVYSACRVYSPNGTELACYRKIHLFDVNVDDSVGQYRESHFISPGTETVSFLCDGVRVGLGICYDLRFPELFRQLLEDGCQVIALPSAFTLRTGSLHWEILNRARAIENQVFMLAANQVGEHSSAAQVSRKTYGHSMVVDYQGKILDQIEDTPGLVFAELDLLAQEEARRSMPVAEHRRLGAGK